MIDLENSPVAVRTSSAISRLGSFPQFVHKWSKKARFYDVSELQLPKYLNFRGMIPDWRPSVGIGGTRSPSVEAFRLATNICRGLAKEGRTIISGGVPGIDLAAHLSVADIDEGASYAVLANPVDMGLAGHEWTSLTLEGLLLRRGGFFSEYNDFVDINGDEFRERLLMRDRIISGLSDVFVVFECNVDSGTVDTARRALAQGKKVICIEAERLTERRGIDQLSRDCGLSILRFPDKGISEIVQHIISM